MLKNKEEISRTVIDNKEYMRDDVIDKEFIMNHLNCRDSFAYKVIKKSNEYGKQKYGQKVLLRGTTILSWYWEYLGLSGEFI
ncbi:hypothetical protein [Streptobacillus moniliformis]|uniref:hypothetical protein n=1 Tax=Streptobacillus moniliformis TaxID=34105 RepID=UPI0007E48FA0|nr:hypothetical protein [Streptobacillus moniliformis]